MDQNAKWNLLKEAIKKSSASLADDARKAGVNEDTVKGGVAAFLSVVTLMEAMDYL